MGGSWSDEYACPAGTVARWSILMSCLMLSMERSGRAGDPESVGASERSEDVREVTEVRLRSAWSERLLRSGTGRCSQAWKDGRLSGWVERRSESGRMLV